MNIINIEIPLFFELIFWFFNVNIIKAQHNWANFPSLCVVHCMHFFSIKRQRSKKINIKYFIFTVSLTLSFDSFVSANIQSWINDDLLKIVYFNYFIETIPVILVINYLKKLSKRG